MHNIYNDENNIMTAQLRGLDDDEATVSSRDGSDHSRASLALNKSLSPAGKSPNSLAALIRTTPHKAKPTNNREKRLPKLEGILKGNDNDQGSSSSSDTSSLTNHSDHSIQPATVTTAVTTKSVQLCTDEASISVKEYPRIPKNKRSALWWSKSELTELYDQQLEELQNSESLEQDYKHVLRTAYLSCKDEDVIEETVSLNFHSMYQCSHVRGLESEVLPQLKHYKKKHRRAVLAAYEAVVSTLDRTNQDETNVSFMTNEEEEYVREQSLSHSRSCRLVSNKMGEFDHLVANYNVTLMNRTPSGRWDEIPELDDAEGLTPVLPQRLASMEQINFTSSESIPSYNTHNNHTSSEETIYLTPSPTRQDAMMLKLTPDPESSSMLEQLPPRPPLLSPRGNFGDGAKSRNLRDCLLRQDSGDLMQPEDRRQLLRQDSSRILIVDDGDSDENKGNTTNGEEEGVVTLKTSKSRRSTTKKTRARRRSSGRKLSTMPPPPPRRRSDGFNDATAEAMSDLPPRRKSAGDTAPRSVQRIGSPRRSVRNKLLVDPEDAAELEKLSQGAL